MDVTKSLKSVAVDRSEEPIAPADSHPTAIPEDEPAPAGLNYIADRCEEIRQALLSNHDLVDANVKVLQWVSFTEIGRTLHCVPHVSLY